MRKFIFKDTKLEVLTVNFYKEINLLDHIWDIKDKDASHYNSIIFQKTFVHLKSILQMLKVGNYK